MKYYYQDLNGHKKEVSREKFFELLKCEEMQVKYDGSPLRIVMSKREEFVDKSY